MLTTPDAVSTTVGDHATRIYWERNEEALFSLPAV